MKAILEFTLPEEEIEHRQALDGHKWEIVVWNLHSACMKHGFLTQIEEAEGKLTTEKVLEFVLGEMEDKTLEFSP